MATYFCYLLRCADGTLYCGWTIDLKNRVRMHQIGKGSRYTRGRLPVSLVYYEKFKSRSEAQKREMEIKRKSKTDKEKLIKDESKHV